MWEYVGTFALALVGGGIGSTIVGFYTANKTAKTAEADRALRQQEFDRKVELEEREYADRERERLGTFKAKRVHALEQSQAFRTTVGHHRTAAADLIANADYLNVKEQERLLVEFIPTLGDLADEVFGLNFVDEMGVLDACFAATSWHRLALTEEEQAARVQAYHHGGLALVAWDRRLAASLQAVEKDESPPFHAPENELSDGLPAKDSGRTFGAVPNPPGED